MSGCICYILVYLYGPIEIDSSTVADHREYVDICSRTTMCELGEYICLDSILICSYDHIPDFCDTPFSGGKNVEIVYWASWLMSVDTTVCRSIDADFYLLILRTSINKYDGGGTFYLYICSRWINDVDTPSCDFHTKLS